MENNHKFFLNDKCKYFPCHKTTAQNEFNCLFCFCPLYFLGDKCGGNFEYHKDIKSCISCDLPHNPEYYDMITSKLKEVNNEAKNAITK